MENIIMWLGMVLLLGIVVFVFFFRYIVYGSLILISGIGIYVLKKLGFISDSITYLILIVIMGLVIILIIKGMKSRSNRKNN